MNNIPKYEIFDDVLTKEEQETLIDIFFDNYFPFYFSANQKTYQLIFLVPLLLIHHQIFRILEYHS